MVTMSIGNDSNSLFLCRIGIRRCIRHLAGTNTGGRVVDATAWPAAAVAGGSVDDRRRRAARVQADTNTIERPSEADCEAQVAPEGCRSFN